jgi:hypothetical protein
MCKEEAESGESGGFPHRGEKAFADFWRKTSTEVKQAAYSCGNPGIPAQSSCNTPKG